MLKTRKREERYPSVITYLLTKEQVERESSVDRERRGGGGVE